MITCGIDVGSRTIKIVLFNDNKILNYDIVDTTINHDVVVKGLFNKLLKKSGLKRHSIKKITATGYGRELIKFADEVVTEITCHAYGVHYFFSNVKSIIEIGGQDSKISRLDGNGNIIDFVMNDRCAAGTGRFLEVVAKLVGMDINSMGTIKQVKNATNISSMCVVFAESEIISLISRKVARNRIIAGVQKAIASRVINLAGKRIEEPVVFTGGVALNKGMLNALSSELKLKINVPPYPQLTGAIGAALI